MERARLLRRVADECDALGDPGDVAPEDREALLSDAPNLPF